MMQTLMLNMDPPQHSAYRKIVATGFTPAIIRTLEPHVREIARTDHRRRGAARARATS